MGRVRLMSTNLSPARAQRRRAAGTKGPAPRTSIWVVHGICGDTRIALLGDLLHEHFYYTEGDPLVLDAEYKTESVKTTLDSEKERPVQFDATVQYLDGHRECRRVRSTRLDPDNAADARMLIRCQAAARKFGATFVQVTPDDLDRHAQRIRNWVRVVGAYQRCRHRPLDLLGKSLLARISSADGGASIGDALGWFSDEAPAMVAAALAALLRKRQLRSDLDEQTWGRHTHLETTAP